MDLDIYIKNNINKFYSKINFHNCLQLEIADMSKKFELKSITEYKIRYSSHSRRIDVVWINFKKEIIFAIEIDSCLRIKSIEKLYHTEAENKIWILYCNNFNKYKFNKLMSEYNKKNEINIIYFNLKKYQKNELNPNRYEQPG